MPLYLWIGLGQRLGPLVARHFMPAGVTLAPVAAGGPDDQPLAVEGTEGLVVDYG